MFPDTRYINEKDNQELKSNVNHSGLNFIVDKLAEVVGNQYQR